ncbi:acid sphingomyelinase-like phosphodiesterase 3b [Clavelina lepadiformis]
MKIIIFLCLCIFLTRAKSGKLDPDPPSSNNANSDVTVGYFWHLSDLHLDFYYDQNEENLTQVCPSSFGAEAIKPGPWGDYKCDSPWNLINASVYAMKKIKGDPDFILWTGDDTLHTNDEDKYLGEDVVIETISNLTSLLKEVFPTTTIYSTLGNHDYHPKNQMPVGNSTLLNGVANLWQDWFTDKNSLEMFRSNGYYSTEVTPGLCVISLNTNIWYSSNHQIDEDDNDPGGQFQWLENTLSEMKKNKEKAYVIGHIPPGYFEIIDGYMWLTSQYNTRYLEIVRSYSDVIVGQFFGHHHTDSFRLVYDGEKKPVSVIWIAPGVTPWMTTLPKVVNGANNPGIRLFEYNKGSYAPTNYVQYYLNLAEANTNGNTDWLEEYNAKSELQLQDIGAVSMNKLWETLNSADTNCPTCPENQMLQKYALYNSVSYNDVHCDETCQRDHVCAIGYLDKVAYEDCIRGDGNHLQQSAVLLGFLSFFQVFFQV